MGHQQTTKPIPPLKKVVVNQASIEKEPPLKSTAIVFLLCEAYGLSYQAGIVVTVLLWVGYFADRKKHLQQDIDEIINERIIDAE